MFLEVWSDGTISPVDAVSRSADLLVQQLMPFVNLVQVSQIRVEQKVAPAAISDEKLNMPVEELDLSVRTMNSLRRGGITTVGELVSKGEKDLLSLRNFGQKSRQEVEEKLKTLGLNLTFSSNKDSEETESGTEESIEEK